MLGAILGLASAAAFGANVGIARRGVLRVSSSYIANISIFTGVVFFLLGTVATGDIFRLGQCSWQSYAFFAVSGVLYFALARTWSYRGIELVGAARSNMVTSQYTIVAIILAMALFKENVTPLMALGIFFTLTSPLLMAIKERTFASGDAVNDGKNVDRRTLYKGLLYSAGAAVCTGGGVILVRLGLDYGGPPVLGNLVGYLVAAILVSPSSFLSAENRDVTLRSPHKVLRLSILSGLATGLAQLFRNLALSYGSVIVVSVMGRTSPLWVLAIAFIFNRKYESLSRWVLLGYGLLMIGSLLVLVS